MAHKFVKLALPAAAMALSVFGLAAGSSAHSTNESAAPMTCEIAVSKGRYGHIYEGVIHANETVKGSYELNFSRRSSNGSSNISQAGDFYVRAGKTETLGQATFGGLPPSAVSAELTLRWKGHKMTCTNQPDEI